MREGDGLVLTGEAVSLRFEPVPAWPEQAVVGRTWRLHQLSTDRPGADPIPAAAHGSCLPDPPAQTVWVEHVISTFAATTRFRDGAEELVLTAVHADPDGARRQLVYRR